MKMEGVEVKKKKVKHFFFFLLLLRAEVDSVLKASPRTSEGVTTLTWRYGNISFSALLSFMGGDELDGCRLLKVWRLMLLPSVPASLYRYTGGPAGRSPETYSTLTLRDV